MSPAEIYQLLRHLTSPVVAITSARGDTRNGMIIDSAIRASISPTVPRLAVFIHKFNFSHDLIFDTGRFALHLLRTDQFELVHRLGFASGRHGDKLKDVPHRLGVLGVPILDDCFAHFECRVVNAMDTGSSTCFLGDVVDVGTRSGGEIMTAPYFRAHLPPRWRGEFDAQLAEAQRLATETATPIRPLVWRDLSP